MRASKDGRIINFSSGLGQLGVPRMGPMPAYSMSKTIVNAITKNLAEELKNTNIIVTSVDPGWVLTDMGGPNAMLTIPEVLILPIGLATAPAHEKSRGHI
jgi:NAD(P)-dependent dehydrogenase (short-subunit alcohol dehydrogenase family)